ncbi:MAG: hypothetical protein WEF50_19175 [Myxococcota bacterium]
MLNVLAAALLGVSLGGMLAGGVLLVPFWREIAPADFLVWFGANARRMFVFYTPLQLGSAILATTAAAVAFRSKSPSRSFAAIAALFAIAVLVPYFLFFQRANAGFADPAANVDEVAAQLARYAAWQWLRIGLGAVAFGSSLLAVFGRGR